MLLTLYVLLIVWSALLLYFVTEQTGAIATATHAIERLTGNKPLRLLMAGWVFSSFLQGVAGFGVPIAIVAPLLLKLGFSPVIAVIAPAIGHSWSVNFGSMATSFEALPAVTGVPGVELTHWSGVLLGLACFLCGWAVVHAHGGWRAFRGVTFEFMVLGIVMSGLPYGLAAAGGWTIAGFSAGIAGIVVSTLLTRTCNRRNLDDAGEGNNAPQSGKPDMSLGWAMAAYLIFILVIVIAALVVPVREALDAVRLGLEFPAMQTELGWQVAAGSGKSISLFGHPGSHLPYTALLAYLIYRIRGLYPPGAHREIWARTVNSGVPTSLGMVPMVCMAIVMNQAGMTFTRAEGVHRALDAAYAAASHDLWTAAYLLTGLFAAVMVSMVIRD